MPDTALSTLPVTGNRPCTVRIPAEAVDDQFEQNLVALMRRLAANKPATRVPSARDCRFCDIAATDCPERMDEGSEPEGRTTSDF